MDSIIPSVYMYIIQVMTLSLMRMSVPAATSLRAISRWPSLTAMKRAVQPELCGRQEHGTHVVYMRYSVYTLFDTVIMHVVPKEYALQT